MSKQNILIITAIVLVIGSLIYFGRVNKSNQVASENTTTSSAEETFKVGDRFPNFRLTEVGNIAIIPDIFLGDPTIIWFTTSWCIPCQIGARDASKLDTELGNDAFDVLVVFIDLNENSEDLIEWRNKFANEDWLVAFDDPQDSLAQKLGVKFLDTKYLLDKNGVIVNIDERQVNSAYLDLIRDTVEKQI